MDDDEGGGGGGEWLTTYSDMVTLLLTFFVLLFAISNVDAMKFAILAKALSRDGVSAEDMMEIKDKYEQLDKNSVDDLNNPTFVGPDDPSSQTDSKQSENGSDGNQNSELSDLYEQIQAWITANQYENSLQAIYNGDDVLITLANDIWFVSGDSAVTPEMQARATVLAQMLAETEDPENPFNIVIAGHTDNVPIHTAQYQDNWDLSVDRATNFMRILFRESDLPPEQFKACGYGEFKPIDTNDTPEGRQHNRRVELLISQALED